MSTRPFTRGLIGGLALLLGVCPGCGTPEYERRLDATLKRLREGSEFVKYMDPPRQLSGTPVRVQLPAPFEGSLLPDEADARRLEPPGIDVPDRKATYEWWITDSRGGKIPFYCYLAATDEDPGRRMARQVRGAFPDSGIIRWERADCETPDGRTIAWQRIEGSGENQAFYYVDPQGQGEFRKLNSKVVFYTRQEGGLFVVIGWRLPTTIEQHVALDKWAPRVAGSVTVKP